MCRILTCVLAGAALAVSGSSWAQPVGVNDWRQGTTLAGFIGGSSEGPGTSVAAGGALGWEITPHFTIEGSGTWIPAGRGADAFAALFGTRVSLLPPHPVVPFVSAAVGVYHAAFDATAATIPGFYGSRMGMRAMGVDAPRLHERRAFDDFVVAIGGGADVFLRRHLALRPDLRVLLVRRSSQTHTVVVAGFSLAYHFEEHPITPAR